MKKALALLLVLITLTSFSAVAFAVTVSDMTGVWLCEEDKYIDIISINKNNAIYLYFTKEDGSVSSVTRFYILVDPDNPNRIIAVNTSSDTPSVQIWTILEDGRLQKTDKEVFTKK